jgi:hypothetical protein
MAREVTTTGSKKLKTLKKQFTEHFPYLRLNLHSSADAKKAKAGKAIYSLNIDKTLSEVREKTGSGKISFSGRKNVSTIEEEFDEIFGLYAQICYTSSEGNRHYTTARGDKKSLSQLNREKEAEGCMKDIWE